MYLSLPLPVLNTRDIEVFFVRSDSSASMIKVHVLSCTCTCTCTVVYDYDATDLSLYMYVVSIVYQSLRMEVLFK